MLTGKQIRNTQRGAKRVQRALETLPCFAMAASMACLIGSMSKSAECRKGFDRFAETTRSAQRFPLWLFPFLAPSWFCVHPKYFTILWNSFADPRAADKRCSTPFAELFRSSRVWLYRPCELWHRSTDFCSLSLSPSLLRASGGLPVFTLYRDTPALVDGKW